MISFLDKCCNNLTVKNLLSIFILFPSFVFADVYLKCTATGKDAARFVQINTTNKEIEVWEYFSTFGLSYSEDLTYRYHLFIDLETTNKYYKAKNKFVTKIDGKNYTWKNERGFTVDRINKTAWHTDYSGGIISKPRCESINSIFFSFQVRALKNRAEKEHGPKF